MRTHTHTHAGAHTHARTRAHIGESGQDNPVTKTVRKLIELIKRFTRCERVREADGKRRRPLYIMLFGLVLILR